MQSLCRPCTNEQHEPSCRTSEERYWQSLAFTRFMTPWMELARKLSKPVVFRQHAPLTRPFAVVDATTNIYAFCLIRLNSSVSTNSDMAHWPVLIRLQSQSSSSAAFRPSSTSLSSRIVSVSTQIKADAIENEVMNELTGDSSFDERRLARRQISASGIRWTELNRSC